MCFCVCLAEYPKILFSKKELKVQLEEQVKETCNATGNPLPTVEWQKLEGDKLIVLAKGSGKAQLLINSVKREDFGSYYCVAKNSLDKRNISVKMEEGW